MNERQQCRMLANEVMEESKLLHSLSAKALTRAKLCVSLLEAVVERRPDAILRLRENLGKPFAQSADLVIPCEALLSTYEDWKQSLADWEQALGNLQDCGGEPRE